MKKKPARLRYEIRFEENCWRFFAPGGEDLWLSGKKEVVVALASARLASAWGMLRVRSELIIKTKAGRVGKDKRSYGDDPRRSRG